MNTLEEDTVLVLDFGKIQAAAQSTAALLPVALQHADTHEVLFVAYANQEALKETLATKRAVLASTSCWQPSTSVSNALPGMLAKPIIDLAVGVRPGTALHETVEPMMRLGWTCRGDAGAGAAECSSWTTLGDGVRRMPTAWTSAESSGFGICGSATCFVAA